VSEPGPRPGGGDQPETPGEPLPTDLARLGAAITGDEAAEPEPPANALFPEELAALVDVGGMSSVSEVTTGGDVVRSVATSRVTDLSLLEGVITLDAVKVTTTTTSDGTRATSDVTTRVAGLSLAGTPLVLDREGAEVAGERVPVEGLPADPNAALEQLGVSIGLPQGERTRQGEAATASVDGLRITLDLRVLRSQLDTGPLEDVVAQVTAHVPEEAAQLKSVVGALFQVAPKLVVTAGNAATSTTTIQGVTFPTVEVPDAPIDTGATGTSGGPGAAAGSGAVSGGAPGTAADAGGAATTTGVATENVAAGLPPLASIPGALLVGGIVLASGVGWWLQRLGGFVIGGAGACTHGLESGIPDLRKA
jgi:hypothetical protein